MNIKKKISKFITKYGAKICTVAVFAAAASTSTCRVSWYQPKEPEGLEKFMQEKININ